MRYVRFPGGAVGEIPDPPEPRPSELSPKELQDYRFDAWKMGLTLEEYLDRYGISRNRLPSAPLLEEPPATVQVHPEAFCGRCLRPNVWSWHAPSPLWNRVMRNLVTGEDRYSVVCPPCFAELAAPVLIGDVSWCFKPHDVDVRPLWKDGDGREWNEDRCLWVEAAAAAEEPPAGEEMMQPDRPKPLTGPEYTLRSERRHPGKLKARRAAKKAFREGRISPPPTVCPKCDKTPRPRADGRRGMEMHHHKGYDYPLDIQWLCWECHAAERRGNKQPSLHVRGVVLKTHCKNGHEFSEENTWWSQGRRNCRACHRGWKQQKRDAAKVAGGTDV